MYVELHIIQSFPPSNLNRDDLGQPKDADFGGVRRARISSQCLKRATRYAGYNEDTKAPPQFETITGVPLGMRTKLIKKGLAERLETRNFAAEAAGKLAGLFAEAYAGGMDQKRKDETAVLLYMSDSELTAIADRIAERRSDLLAFLDRQAQWEVDLAAARAAKKKDSAPLSNPMEDLATSLVKQTSGRSSAPDIALFGRMLADDPKTNVDAACQVAHAISTHDIGGKTPIDYYTAMDDLKPSDEPGAGFLDVAYFNSATFYRYARLDFEQLKYNLGAEDLQGNKLSDLPYKTVEAFLRASEAAIPGGKKNSHAQECRPSFMLAVVRADCSAGWSLVNAFQRPVDARRDGDLVVASVQALEERFTHLRKFYATKDPQTGKVDDTVVALAVALPDGCVLPTDLGSTLHPAVQDSLDDWVAVVCDALRNGG